MAESASDADPSKGVLSVHHFLRALEPDHRIQLEQRHRGRGGVEVCGLKESRGQDVRVHLETDRKCRDRTHATLDDLVDPKGIGPKGLVAEGVEPKGLLALSDLNGGGLVGTVIAAGQQCGQEGGVRERCCSSHPSRWRNHDPTYPPTPRQSVSWLTAYSLKPGPEHRERLAA